MDKQRAIANALTAIDGRFLEEAEIYAAPHKRNLLRPMLSAAACLLLVAGLTFLWPRPLKLQVNGENVWKGAVSISQEAEPMALLAVRTVSVPLTLDPGRGGTVTVDADTNSVLEQNGEERQSLTLQKAAAFIWLLYPDDTQEFYLTVTQGQTEYLLRALVEESGSITLQRVQS